MLIIGMSAHTATGSRVTVEKPKCETESVRILAVALEFVKRLSADSQNSAAFATFADNPVLSGKSRRMAALQAH